MVKVLSNDVRGTVQRSLEHLSHLVHDVTEWVDEIKNIFYTLGNFTLKFLCQTAN